MTMKLVIAGSVTLVVSIVTLSLWSHKHAIGVSAMKILGIT